MRFHPVVIGAVAAAVALAIPGRAGADALDVPQGRHGIGPDLGTDTRPMLSPLAGWHVDARYTVGEEAGGYLPLGILDGMGAITLDHRTVRVFVNHEVNDDQGYAYELTNGTRLLGARVSYFDFHEHSRKLIGAGLAYDTIVDRYGDVVTAARQINEGVGNVGLAGFDRFCSAWLGRAGEYGLEDDIFFTGEETGNGQEFALDVHGGIVYCAPALGRAAFESVAMIDSPDPTKVAVVIGDDRAPAPLLVYVGEKDAAGDGSFLDRNGLARGRLYTWASDDGDANPSTFRGTGATRTGRLVEVDYFDPAQAGMPGYDAQGYANQGTQDARVASAGGFLFARPEDVSTNPSDGSQVVLASTGRSALFGGADRWGTTYVIDFDLTDMSATITIAYDGDDAGGGQFAGPDHGLRCPDNLVWSSNGKIYVQEDRSTSAFGRTSRQEASIWELDPVDGTVMRIAQVDRSAIPPGQIDTDPNDLGDWETSGILDVTGLFRTSAKERLLLATVQAHSLRGGVISSGNLVQGGQLVLLSFREDENTSPHAESGFDRGVLRVTASPNPFNPRTTIRFALPAAADTRLDIIDLRGRVVRTLVRGNLAAGDHSYTWDGVDHARRPVATGAYFFRLSAGDQRHTGKLLLVK